MLVRGGLAWRPWFLRLPILSHPNSRRKRERGEKQRKPGGSSWKTFFALGRGPSIPRKKQLPWLGGSRAPPQPSGQSLRPCCGVVGVAMALDRR